MKFKLLYLVVLLGACTSNDNDLDCAAVSCEALNYSIILEDATTGDNLIETLQLEASDLRVTHNNEVLNGHLENNAYKVYPTATQQTNILFFNDTLITYSFGFTAGGTTCCDFGSLTNAIVTDYTFVVQDNTITIKL